MFKIQERVKFDVVKTNWFKISFKDLLIINI